MATVDYRDLVDTLIANNGRYKDDPQVVKIVEYQTKWGGTAWGLVYPTDDPDRYVASEFVRNPKTIWQRTGEGST